MPAFGIISVSLSSSEDIEERIEYPLVDVEEAIELRARAHDIDETLLVRAEGPDSIVGQLIVPPHLTEWVLERLED